MPLVNIESGSLADPEIVNNNFDYLDDRITETENKIYTNNATIESQISTLSQNISEINDEIDDSEEDITNLQNSISQLQTKVVTALIPNYSRGKQVSSGYVAEYNGWLRCQARIDSYGSHVYVNGVKVFGAEPNWLSSWSGWSMYGMIFVGQGQTVTYDNNASGVFYPCRGV